MKKLLAAVAALLVSLPAVAQKQDVLHLYNWNNYMSDDTIKRFEGMCKCKVKQTYYSDNDELLAKLQAGGKGYDVMVPTMNAVEALIKMNALLPLDQSKVPNMKNVAGQYMNTAFDPGNRYSVPYAMTITLIGYNDAKIRELGVPVESWATIFDPAILAKIKGKVTVLDSQREVMGAALRYLGYSVNDTVVIFDRLRENLLKYKTMPLRDVMNLSTNETLSRTVVTAGTTLLALIPLLVFGGDVIRGFIFAMTLGVFFGTYSTVYVAKNIVLWIGLPRGDKAKKSTNEFADIDA